MNRRIKKLTPEQKKIVWSKPTTNAGQGFESDNDRRPGGNSNDRRIADLWRRYQIR
jgi:hypothetical protein